MIPHNSISMPVSKTHTAIHWELSTARLTWTAEEYLDKLLEPLKKSGWTVINGAREQVGPTGKERHFTVRMIPRSLNGKSDSPTNGA